VVQALLDAGAQVNFQSPEYGTALIAATVANRPDNVAVLLKAGADQSIRLSPDQLYEYGVDDGELTQKCAIEIARLRKLKKVVSLLEAATKGGATKGGAKVKQRQPIDVTATWKTLDAWLRRERPSLKKTLRAGAAASDIRRVERRLGRDLPGEFKQSCQVHDGQKAGAECLSPALRAGEPGFVLLTLDQMAASWTMHKRLLDSGEFSGAKSQASAEVSRDWWSPGWIPFASDGGGDFLCLDMAPAAKGTVGQVISFRHDSGERRRLAVSFGDWLNALCSELQD
jgi:cell wall assembly regulator SMI1